MSITVSCASCLLEFRRQPSRVRATLNFCSNACRISAQRIGGALAPLHYGTGTRDYRDIAFRAHGRQCSGCGYRRDQRMLDVHHKDEDRKNNSIDNLAVLCVWCHALISRGVEPHRRKPRAEPSVIVNRPIRYRGRVDAARLIALLESGMSPKAASRELQISHQAIYKAIARFGIKPWQMRRGSPEVAAVP